MKIHNLKFSIDIKADKSRIWKALWDDQSYRNWTSVFMEGSHAVTDNWMEGSRVHFLTADRNGIYSLIEKHVPHKIMAFKHLGNVINGEEQPIDDETKKWSGTTEVYILKEKSDCISLEIEIDVMDEHLEYMSETFPKALEKIKDMCS